MCCTNCKSTMRLWAKLLVESERENSCTRSFFIYKKEKKMGVRPAQSSLARPVNTPGPASPAHSTQPGTACRGRTVSSRPRSARCWLRPQRFSKTRSSVHGPPRHDPARCKSRSVPPIPTRRVARPHESAPASGRGMGHGTVAPPPPTELDADGNRQPSPPPSAAASRPGPAS